MALLSSYEVKLAALNKMMGGEKLLTAEHVLFPHTLSPIGDPAGSVWWYGKMAAIGGVSGYGLGAALQKDPVLWAKWGAGLLISAGLIGRYLLLADADREYAEVELIDKEEEELKRKEASTPRRNPRRRRNRRGK